MTGSKGGRRMAFTDQELEEQLMAEAQKAIKALLAQTQPSDEITLTEIERLVRQAGEKIMEEMTASLVEASQDIQQIPGPPCPHCGQEMAYKGHKEKNLTTETGKAQVRRAYYYCEACAVGLFPPG
jgi:DNA repair exonuclease SbcCD ATPase subunit